MKKYLKTIAVFLTLTTVVYAAKITKDQIATPADLSAAGAPLSQLPNASQIFSSTFNQPLDQYLITVNAQAFLPAVRSMQNTFVGAQRIGAVTVTPAGGTTIYEQGPGNFVFDTTPASNANPADIAAAAAPGGVTLFARGDHVHKGLHSLHADASANLFGDVQLVSGTAVTLAQAGNVITINGTPGGAPGVTSVQNTLAGGLRTGAITVTPAGGTSIYELNPGNFAFDTAVPSSVAAQSVSSVNSAGGVTLFARADHTHQGVHGLQSDANGFIFNNVSLLSGAGVTLSQSGQNVTLATTPSVTSVQKSGGPARTGAITVTPAGGTTINEPFPGQFVFDTASPSSVAAQSVGSANSAGGVTLFARGDHVHQGIHSIGFDAGAALFGDLVLLSGSGVTLTPAGQNVTLATTDVNSIKSNGNALLSGAVQFSDGVGITLTQSGQVITVNKKSQFEFDAGNSGAALAINFATAEAQKVTLTNNCTFTLSAVNPGDAYVLRLVQDGVGSRTATWPASVKWPAGTAPTLSTAAAAQDLIILYFDGVNYRGSSSLGY